MKRALKLGLLGVLASWGSMAMSQSVLGDWMTDNKSAIIRVAPCGAKMCGTVIRLLKPNAPAYDANNPDPAKRSQPMIGTLILEGFSRAANGWDGGTVYDPGGGRIYKSRIASPDGQTLNVTGCIAFLCRTKHWTRAEGATASR